MILRIRHTESHDNDPQKYVRLSSKGNRKWCHLQSNHSRRVGGGGWEAQAQSGENRCFFISQDCVWHVEWTVIFYSRARAG